jgi:hypothetical protein
MNREQRIAALEQAVNNHADQIGLLLKTNVALRCMLFAMAHHVGLERDHLHETSRRFAEGIAGNDCSQKSIAEFVGEIQRLLCEYEDLTKAA